MNKGSSKIKVLENKGVQKMKLENNVFCRNSSPKLIIFNKKKNLKKFC